MTGTVEDCAAKCTGTKGCGKHTYNPPLLVTLQVFSDRLRVVIAVAIVVPKVLPAGDCYMFLNEMEAPFSPYPSDLACVRPIGE